MRDHKVYPVQAYTKACQEFSQDTAKWGELSEYRYYDTTGSGWNESCDGGTGGVDVSWAFHESAEYIDYYAAEIMLDNLLDELQNAIDEKCDYQQLQAIVDKYNL